MLMTSRNTNEIRRSNRARVLGRLIRDGPTTRLDLAQSCELSLASVTNLVQLLQAEGLVTAGGAMPSTGGRPSSLVHVITDAACFIGVDVGENGVTAALYDLSLECLDTEHSDTASREAPPREIGSAIGEAMTAISQRNPRAWRAAKGVGLALPGIVDTSEGGAGTLYAQSIGWAPIEVEELFDAGGLPLTADNGAKAHAKAEQWRGALYGPDGAEEAAVALIGRGLGLGILSRGHVLRGLTSSAGEWGHTKVAHPGRPCTCGARGCLEAYIGGSALEERWLEAGGEPQPGPLACAEHIIAQARVGDPVAARLLDEMVAYAALGLSNVVNLFNPGVCVVGGWLGNLLMAARGPQIESRTKEFSLRHPAEQVRVRATHLGPEAITLGGAITALENFISEGSAPSAIAQG